VHFLRDALLAIGNLRGDRMTERAGTATIRVIGVGNASQGDDAVGLLAARRLRERLGSSVEVIEADGDGLALLDLMEGVGYIILIDAMKGGGRPGTAVRLDLSTENRWTAAVPCSTHAMGIAEAVDLARVLGRLPTLVVLYGIELESVESGASLSGAVQDGLAVVLEQVSHEVERARCMKCI
jgi:hydrogenase maturation protease